MKEHKTADCVVVGIRWKGDQKEDGRTGGARTSSGRRRQAAPRAIATLLLGLYRDDGGLDYVGTCAVAAGRRQEVASKVLPLLVDAPDRRFSEPNRWGTGELEEAAVRPDLVVEVRYDKVQGSRFRHGTKLIRWRDDKDPADCTWRELRPPKSKRSVEQLFA